MTSPAGASEGKANAFAEQAARVSGPSGGVRDMATWNGSDAAGDVPYCQGDIVSASSDYADGAITLSTTLACSSNPYSSPNWTVGETLALWLIDLNGDNTPDYSAALGNDGNGALIAVVFQGAGGAVVCSASASWNGDRTVAASFSPSCIGSPGSIRVAHGMSWDENPYGSTCQCPLDVAPNSTYSDPIAKGTPPPPPPPPPSKRQGYWMIGRTGDTYAFGDAANLGNTPSGNVVDLEPTPSGNGYWTTNAAGNVYGFGDARYFGGGPALTPGESVTSISRTNDGGGYWLFTTTGRVISFGNARYFGDMSGKKLNGPVLDSIPTATGNGYYMVASDGGIFTFGDAAFFGSTGSMKLNAPVQSLVPDPDGAGYWLVASDGGIFAFDAVFYGSMGDRKLSKPVTGMVGFGNGYLMVGEDGGIFTFGEAPYKGSLGANPPAQPIVSVAMLNL